MKLASLLFKKNLHGCCAPLRQWLQFILCLRAPSCSNKNLSFPEKDANSLCTRRIFHRHKYALAHLKKVLPCKRDLYLPPTTVTLDQSISCFILLFGRLNCCKIFGLMNNCIRVCKPNFGNAEIRNQNFQTD